MTLVPKINRYFAVTFPSSSEAINAATKLQDFVVTDVTTIKTMVGSNRVVILDSGPTLFLSRMAYELLSRLVPGTPAAVEVAPVDLPEGYGLLLGDQRDLDRQTE